MATRSQDLGLGLPLRAPADPADHARMNGGLFGGYRSLRERWICLGPRCLEREGLRAWCKLPARIQLQEGWCCSPQCFQEAVEQRTEALLPQVMEMRPQRRHRIPLGLLLLSRGLINQAQLRQALEAQAAEGRGRVGDWLQRQQAASEDTIALGVGLQWARPTFPLAQSQQWRSLRGWAPLALLEAKRMLPVHYAAQQERLYVGFAQAVDFNALAALSTILDCKTEACIVTDSALEAALEQLRSAPAAEGETIEDVVFDRVATAAEMASIIRQYAQRADARQIRLAEANPFVWVRIRGREKTVHLTFRPRG